MLDLMVLCDCMVNLENQEQNYLSASKAVVGQLSGKFDWKRGFMG